MSECEYYASIYHDSSVGHISLGSEKTTIAHAKAIDQSLPELYATVIVFLVRAGEYFSQPLYSMETDFFPMSPYLIPELCTESKLYFTV